MQIVCTFTVKQSIEWNLSNVLSFEFYLSSYYLNASTIRHYSVRMNIFVP